MSGTFKRILGEDGKGFFPKWTSHRESLGHRGLCSRSLRRFWRPWWGTSSTAVSEKAVTPCGISAGDTRRAATIAALRSASGGHSTVCLSDPAAPLQWGRKNLFLYCYRRDWLDRHMEQAEKGIRFIDPHYKELFRIPDGGTGPYSPGRLRVHRPDLPLY